MITLQKLFEQTRRSELKIGMKVCIVQKHHQRTGQLTCGIVKRILTSKEVHTRGIKVELQSGEIGRVQKIIK